MAAAPADSTCSHSGIFTCGAARLTTAITSGARARRWRSNSTCSVPDHGKLTPWRFIVFEGDARLAAGAAIVTAFRAKNPEAKPAARDGQKLIDFSSGRARGRQCHGFEGTSRGKEFNGIGHGVPNKARSRVVKEPETNICESAALSVDAAAFANRANPLA